MHTPRWAPLLCALAFTPLPQQAMANTLNLTLTGVASPGFQDALNDPSMSSPTTDFSGQPVTIALTISDPGGAASVSAFSVTWSNQTFALPVMTSYSGNGLPGQFMSNVTLTSTGGEIDILPSPAYIQATGGLFYASLDYTTSAPHDPLSSFTDTATGGGSLQGYAQFPNNPTFGYFDNTVTGDFTLTRVIAADVPEPAAWAMTLLGLFTLGGTLRVRRRAMATI